jgi:hypothetical protein
MLLGFKRRFASFVADGSKTHTIRAIRKNLPRPGEMCHCYVDPRQKTMRLLGRWKCVKVEEIIVTRYELVMINDQPLTVDECNALAWRDGFRSRGYEDAFDEMMEFWKGRLPFKGHVIHWKYSKRGSAAGMLNGWPPPQCLQGGDHAA